MLTARPENSSRGNEMAIREVLLLVLRRVDCRRLSGRGCLARVVGYGPHRVSRRGCCGWVFAVSRRLGYTRLSWLVEAAMRERRRADCRARPVDGTQSGVQPVHFGDHGGHFSFRVTYEPRSCDIPSLSLRRYDQWIDS